MLQLSIRLELAHELLQEKSASIKQIGINRDIVLFIDTIHLHIARESLCILYRIQSNSDPK